MPRLPTDSVLRHLAQTALAEFGVGRCRLTHLASRHNDVFRVDVAPRQRFVLRIQNDLMTDAQARSQVEWLESLIKHSDVTVPAPVRTSDGRPFTYINTGEVRRRAMLLQWLPGRLTRRRDEGAYRAAARMIARLHDHAERFRPRRGSSHRRLDGDWLFTARFFIRAANAGQHHNASHRRLASRAERLVRDAMEGLGHRRQRFGVIHADLNLDNIIFHLGYPSTVELQDGSLLTVWYEQMKSSPKAVLRQSRWEL